MVYTVTFNPALDYVMNLNEFTAGETNRSQAEKIFIGGKGINVSIVLARLGANTAALGFTAGFVGLEIERIARDLGVNADFIHVENGCSRINVKLKQSGGVTEINARGAEIPQNALEKLYRKLDGLTDGDFLVLAGSVPDTLPRDIYAKILERLQDKRIKIVVDAEKDLLLNTLKYKPFLIKPNKSELERLFGEEISTDAEIIARAKRLREMGAVNVLVSLGGDGAVLVDEHGEVHKRGACKGQVKNTVGAGDSMVAGFIAGSSDGDYEYALKLATAAGGATAFSEEIASREEILLELGKLCDR